MLEINCDYMILRGPMAVGKTTTGRALFKYLNKIGIERAFIPFDMLRKLISRREPSYELKKIHTENAVVLANKFISEGYFTILEGVYAIQELLDYLKTNIHGEYKLFQLNCDINTLLKRDSSNDRAFSCGCEKINLALQILKENSNKNPEEIIIDNTYLSVDEVVDKIINNITNKN